MFPSTSYDQAHAQEPRNRLRAGSQDAAVSDLQDAIPERMGWRAYLSPLQGDREVAYRHCVALLSPAPIHHSFNTPTDRKVLVMIRRGSSGLLALAWPGSFSSPAAFKAAAMTALGSANCPAPAVLCSPA